MLNLLHSLAMWEIILIFAKIIYTMEEDNKYSDVTVIGVPLGSIRKHENELKRCFGYSLVDFNNELMEQYTSFHTIYANSHNNKLPNLSFEDFCNGLSDDFILDVEVPDQADPDDIIDWLLQEKYLNPNEDESILEIIRIITILYYHKQVEQPFDAALAEGDYRAYTEFVRPDMLNLYIALRAPKVRGASNQVKVSFNGNSPVLLENKTDWITFALNRYLGQYLGVKSVEDAEKELAVLYVKTTGNKMKNKDASLYMWGLAHLLQHSSFSKSEKFSVSKKMSRFIAEYLTQVGIIDKLQENFDYENIRGQINYLVKQFDSIEDLFDYRDYLLSPHNNSKRYF